MRLATKIIFIVACLDAIILGAIVNMPREVVPEPTVPSNCFIAKDYPLLDVEQKLFAKQRGYIVIKYNGVNYIIVNIDKEYLR